MTLIATWISSEPNLVPTIWCAGDSKISNTNNEETLTLEGSKVLELPLICKDLTTPYQYKYFRSSLGFAFAGSTLVGLNTYATLNTILSNLGGVQVHNHLPDYKSIVNKAKEVLKFYTSSIRNVAEVSIFGICPKTQKPFIGTIRPIQTTVIDYSIELEYGTSETLKFKLLGDQKNEVTNLINQELLKFSKYNNIYYWRTPIKVLKELIEQNTYKSIGGNIQLATLTYDRFDLLSVTVPIKGFANKVTLKFRNIDMFEDIGISVGECVVSINGMNLTDL